MPISFKRNYNYIRYIIIDQMYYYVLISPFYCRFSKKKSKICMASEYVRVSHRHKFEFE